jgi:hypothetical protein
VLYCVIANPLSRSRLQGWLNRRVPNAPVWCSVRSLLACRWDVAERTGRAGRGRAVMLCAAGAVTNRIPYHSTKVFTIYFVHKLSPPLSLHPRSRTHALHARTPHICALRSAHTVPQSRPSCTRRNARTQQDARFSLLVASFLLRTYAGRRTFAPV